MFVLTILLSLTVNVFSDTVCVTRAVATKSENLNREYGLEPTIIPGVFGAGMKPILPIGNELWGGPVAIMGDSRTDPNEPQWNDIDPRLQPMREGSSLASWAPFRWAAAYYSPAKTAVPLYRRRPEAQSYIYTGVNDFQEMQGGEEWWVNVRDYNREFKRLLTQYMAMESVITSGTQLSGKSVCSSPGRITLAAPKGGRCLLAFFSPDLSSSCLGPKGTLSGKKMEIFIYGEDGTSFDFNCAYTCRHYCFYEADPSPDGILQIFSPIDSGRQQYTPFFKFTQEANLTYGDVYPSDGYDLIHGSPTVRRWFGFPGSEGRVFMHRCESDGGGTNETAEFGKVTYLPSVTLGRCPTLVSSTIDIPKIPTLYATREIATRQPTTKITVGGIIVTILGGIIAGPIGALIGLSGALSGGGGLSKHDVDLEIDRKLKPALDTINENFAKQATINKGIMDIELTLASAVRSLTENQMQTQLELTAVTMVMNALAISDEAAASLKAQLRAYAEKNGLKWDETTGCVDFEYPCNAACLAGIVNQTEEVTVKVNYLKNITFGVAELAPDVKERLDFSLNLGIGAVAGLVGTIVFIIIIAIVVFIVWRGGCRCERTGGSSGGKPQPNMQKTIIKL